MIDETERHVTDWLAGVLQGSTHVDHFARQVPRLPEQLAPAPLGAVLDKRNPQVAAGQQLSEGHHPALVVAADGDADMLPIAEAAPDLPAEARALLVGVMYVDLDNGGEVAPDHQVTRGPDAGKWKAGGHRASAEYARAVVRALRRLDKAPLDQRRYLGYVLVGVRGIQELRVSGGAGRSSLQRMVLATLWVLDETPT
jgi:hypothetical protein